MKKNKNTFFCCALAEPWIDVALELNKNYNLKPVYWIGWKDEKPIISQKMSGTIYHDMSLAWKGIFPSLNFDINNIQIDGLDFKTLAEKELMALKMMDRLDYNRNSFNFSERQNYFRDQLNKWLNVLINLDVELIVAPSIPHRVFDYIIYVASKILKIDFFTVKMTPWAGHILPMNSITSYFPLKEEETFVEIHKEVSLYIEKIQKKYDEAVPYYMLNQKKDESKSKLIRIIETLTKNKGKNIFKLFQEKPIYWKKKGVSLQESTFYGIEVYLEKLRGISYKNRLKKHYQSICSKVDLNLPYILVALHYQPEETSCPSGDIYVDQLLMIKSLLKNTSQETLIYVKEHKSQFNPSIEGQTGRVKSFYEELQQFSRVRLVFLGKNIFDLIDNSLAIATLTGTIGVEALFRKKTPIVFGTAWYESLPSVIRIKDKNDLKKINSLSKLTELINIEQCTIALNRIYLNCIKANHYKGVKERSSVTMEDSIINLVKFISKQYRTNV
ncbi:MAG: hypothetical protein ACPGTO_01885 [Polaribacter sp.]